METCFCHKNLFYVWWLFSTSNGDLLFKKYFGPQLEAFKSQWKAMVGHAMDRRGLKDYENAPNSFLPKINRTVF